jgi:hypothetical protein
MVSKNPTFCDDLKVKAPETEHVVSVRKLHAWLDGGGKSPNEQVAKKRLKEILRR